jgi:hypothetical protein
VKLSPSHRLYGLGAIILIALLICARNFSGDGEAFPVVPLAIAGIAYLLGVRELFCSAGFPKRVILVGLILAAVWHGAFLAIPTGSDDDVRRYLWDGRMQRLGYSPYAVVPADPALATLHTPDTRALNNAYLSSPYPPGAQLFFRAVTAIHESTFALRVAFLICEIAILLLLLDILRCTGQAMHWVLAFAWNPLLATEVAGSGHVDILGVMLVVLSFASLIRRWRALAAVAFALAIAVKFLPIVLVPLYWRRIRIRDAILAALVFVLLYVPFLDHGRIPTGSLGTYIQSFRFNSPVFAALERIAAPQAAAGIAALVGFAIAAWFRRKSDTFSADAFAWPMASSLLCAPMVYPWYLLWLLPFVRSVSTTPLMIWTVSILPTYIIWHLRSIGRPWILPGWVLLLEYGLVAITAAIVLWRRIAAPRSRS